MTAELPPATRAGHADRDAVVDLLTEAYAEGRLDPEEHAERVEQAMAAKTLGELAPLTADLVPAGTPSRTPVPVPQGEGPVVRPSAEKAMNLVAIMGGADRRGGWTVPAEINAYSLMGGADIDLTEAVFSSDTVTIKAWSCMGGLTIRVPEGVEVIDRTFSLMGGVEIKNSTAGAPVRVIIEGFNLMGGVEVTGPRVPIAEQVRRALGTNS